MYRRKLLSLKLVLKLVFTVSSVKLSSNSEVHKIPLHIWNDKKFKSGIFYIICTGFSIFYKVHNKFYSRKIVISIY